MVDENQSKRASSVNYLYLPSVDRVSPSVRVDGVGMGGYPSALDYPRILPRSQGVCTGDQDTKPVLPIREQPHTKRAIEARVGGAIADVPPEYCLSWPS